MTTLDRAKSWLEQDPDPETRAELAALIPAAEAGDAAAMESLHDRFDSRLTFGTAGLRGELGAGSNRMNRVLVSQAATGFARWLLDHDENASVVIGYDGRINSDVFARDSAELMAGAGVRVLLMPRAVPTPVLAFAVRHLGLSAGVMVTASDLVFEGTTRQTFAAFNALPEQDRSFTLADRERLVFHAGFDVRDNEGRMCVVIQQVA